jgi:hypothetical protein
MESSKRWRHSRGTQKTGNYLLLGNAGISKWDLRSLQAQVLKRGDICAFTGRMVEIANGAELNLEFRIGEEYYRPWHGGKRIPRFPGVQNIVKNDVPSCIAPYRRHSLRSHRSVGPLFFAAPLSFISLFLWREKFRSPRTHVLLAEWKIGMVEPLKDKTYIGQQTWRSGCGFRDDTTVIPKVSKQNTLENCPHWLLKLPIPYWVSLKH